MARIEKTVFISYRRTNIPWAVAIQQNLTHNGYDIFFDYEGIASGDFESVIIENIRARAHFLVVLTPSALERCDEPGDWLCREIETALDTKRNIVPLMLEGFDFGAPAIAKHLTGKISALKNYNALSVPSAYFEEAMKRLREKYLNVALDAVLHPASSSAKQVAKAQQAAVNNAPPVKERELTAQEWFERGYKLNDNSDEHIRYYSEAIRLKPDYAEAFNNRGNVRQDRGDLEGALKDFNEAIRLKPDYALAFNNRGIARKARSDLEGALKDYDEAIRLKPDYADAFYNRGNARQARGELEGALKDYDEAIRLKPDYALAFNNRGIARKARSDLEGALKDYDEAIRLKPDYADAFYNRGIARKARSDLEGALKDYNEAIRLKPKVAFAFYNRGFAREDRGDLEGALKDYDEAIRLKPDYINAYYNRALILKKQAAYSSAINDYQKYLDLGGGIRDGDQAKVEEMLRDLKKKL